MSILGDVGNALGAVAKPVENAVAPVVQPIEHGLEDFGHGAVQLLGKPAPQYAVNPQTGQMVTTQGPATAGDMFKKMLLGALGGLAAEKRGQTFGESMGAGFSNVLRQQQQQKLMAEQKAQDEFANHMRVLQQTDKEKAFKVQSVLAVAREKQLAAQTRELDTQSQATMQRMFQSAVGNYSKIGYSLLGSFPKNTTESQAIVELSKKNPSLPHDLAAGSISLLVDPSGGFNVYQTSHSLASPIPEPITVNYGNGLTRTIAAGTPRGTANSIIQQAYLSNEGALRTQSTNQARLAAAQADVAAREHISDNESNTERADTMAKINALKSDSKRNSDINRLNALIRASTGIIGNGMKQLGSGTLTQEQSTSVTNQVNQAMKQLSGAASQLSNLGTDAGSGATTAPASTTATGAPPKLVVGLPPGAVWISPGKKLKFGKHTIDIPTLKAGQAYIMNSQGTSLSLVTLGVAQAALAHGWHLLAANQ